MKKVLFISSGGGHLTELMKLNDMFSEYDYHIITEKTDTTNDLINKYEGKVDYLKYGTKKNMLTYPFIFLSNIIKSKRLFKKINPDVIITTGTHTAVPMCFIAKKNKRKVIYIETFASIKNLSVTGKIMYKKADLFIVQHEELLKSYKNAVYGGWIF